MGIAGIFRRRPPAPAADPTVVAAEERRVAAERRREEAESRRESERRWYARLPIIAIATLSVSVAGLTLLMAIASQYTLVKAKEGNPETPVKPAPPAPSAPAAKPVTLKISLQNKALFGYNSSTLRVVGAAAQQELDVCLKPGLTRVQITGHADCIGTDAYNQALSERRAAAVKRYLSEKGIDAALITAEGKGAALAKGEFLCARIVRPTARDVRRLEPFRRVDVSCEYARPLMQV